MKSEDLYSRNFLGIWIPKSIWLDDRLSAVDRILIAEITSLDNPKTHCFASNEKLALFCKCSARTISRSIAHLAEFGYIKVISFDGRDRVICSCVDKMSSLPSQNGEAATPICPAYNIVDNIKDKTTTTTTGDAEQTGEAQGETEEQSSPYWPDSSASETGATEREQERESSAKERDTISVYRMASGRSAVSQAERTKIGRILRNFRADLVQAAIMDAAMCGADKVNMAYIAKILDRCNKDGIKDAAAYADAKAERDKKRMGSAEKSSETLEDW
jgi:DNA replication protein DnaD